MFTLRDGRFHDELLLTMKKLEEKLLYHQSLFSVSQGLAFKGRKDVESFEKHNLLTIILIAMIIVDYLI